MVRGGAGMRTQVGHPGGVTMAAVGIRGGAEGGVGRGPRWSSKA